MSGVDEKQIYLGINSAYHESSAALVVDGKVVAFAEEERFNRVKHAKPARVDNPDELPWNAISYCLQQAGLKLEDVSVIGYTLDPEQRKELNLAHNHNYEVTPGDFGTQEGEEKFYRGIKNVENKLNEKGFKGDLRYLNHHECHAASAFYPSSFQDAAVLVIDGIGEFESTSWYSGKRNDMKLFGKLDYPNSLGFLWEKISKYLGFSAYDACKVMGLAAYEAENYESILANMRTLVKINDDGTFVIDDSIIQFRHEDYSGLEKLFGGLKKKGEPVKDAYDEKRYVAVAKALQEVTEEIVIKLAKKVKAETGSNNLCLAGGVALNCVANGKLLEEKIFDNVFVQPAANDAGTALGAAYLISVQEGNARPYDFNRSYTGPEFSDEAVELALQAANLKYEKSNNIARDAAELIAEGQVVGWFQGRMELGPRALGNRSLLADPRRCESRDNINGKFKFREQFRPLCPSVLAEKIHDCFDFVSNGECGPENYMLAAVKTREEFKDKIPAVLHVDGTARIQSVREQDNPLYHALISEFEKETGIPVLLNTSLNSNEPIVCTPEEAIGLFKRTRIDALAIGGYVVLRDEQNA